MSISSQVVGAVANAAAPVMVSTFMQPPLPPELGMQGLISDARVRALNAEDNSMIYPWIFVGLGVLTGGAIACALFGSRSARTPKPGAD